MRTHISRKCEHEYWDIETVGRATMNSGRRMRSGVDLNNSYQMQAVYHAF